MEHIIDNPNPMTSLTLTDADTNVSGPAYEAYQILRTAFTGYYDVALRDFGLALAAFALARLSAKLDH